MIDGLRKRKVRLFAYSFALMASVAALVVLMRIYDHGLSVVHGYDHPRPDHVLSPEELAKIIPGQLSQLVELSLILSRIYLLSVVYALLAGVFLIAIILEIFGLSRNRILVRLWDEVELLKKERRT